MSCKMYEWAVKRTDSFLRYLKKHKNNHELFTALDKKIKSLKEDPSVVGGNLAGNLHGYKSTRLIRKFRLVFSVDKESKIVYLVALDHREDVY